MTLSYHFNYEFDDGSDFDYEDYEYTPTQEEIDEGWHEFIDPEMEKVAADNSCDPHDYYEDEFKEFMHDWCYDSAHDAFKDDPEVPEMIEECLLYQRDPYSYYGVSRYDFL